MAAVTEILYINTDGAAGVRGTPTAIGALDSVDAKGVSWAFQGDVTVAGDLTVAGDIISRGQVNLVIQDSFLDLGFGNYTTDAASGGFTVQMNRSASFTPYTTPAALSAITEFTNSTTFKYDSANSKLLTAGMVIAITNLTQAEAANEGLFVVNTVTLDAGTVYDVTIQTTGLGNAPWAQTAFVPAAGTAFPNVVTQGTAFQVDLAVLCVSDGVNFPTVSPAVWPKGTFLQAYFPAADDSSTAPSGFNADYAYNVIGGTTLQQAYNNSTDPATILTAANKELLFSLNATGPFQVQGPGAVNFGGAGLTDLASVEVVATGAVQLNSTGGALGFGDVSGTGNISIGTLGTRAAITIGSTNVTAATLEADTLNIGNGAQAHTLYIASKGFWANVVRMGSGTDGAAINVNSKVYIDSKAINVGTSNDDNRAITIGINATGSTLKMDSSTINLGASSGFATDHTINVGTDTGAVQTISIGTTASGFAGSTKVLGQNARIGAGLNAAGTQADNTISVETLASSGVINIGTAAYSHTINIGTTAAAAQVIEIGDTAAGNAGWTRIEGQNAIIAAGGNYDASGQSDKSISIQTLAGKGYIFLGTLGHAHAIAIGSDNNNTQQIYIGGVAAGSYTLVSGGQQVGLRLNTESGAGVSVQNDSGGALASGQVVCLATGVTPSSTARPNVQKADAAAASAYARRFFGVIQEAGVANTTGGYATTVPGTVAQVAWTGNAGGIPSAGDEGKPVFLESSAVNAAGVATLLAPSASGEAVVQIGYLASDTASGGGLYAVVLAPQFIGQIP